MAQNSLAQLHPSTHKIVTNSQSLTPSQHILSPQGSPGPFHRGALMINAIKQPAIVAQTGTVNIHPPKIHNAILQFMAFQFPLHKPTAIVAPTIHWAVETGNPNLDATRTVNADPNSILNPRDGECKVNLFPRFFITLYPHVAKPITIARPP